LIRSWQSRPSRHSDAQVRLRVQNVPILTLRRGSRFSRTRIFATTQDLRRERAWQGRKRREITATPVKSKSVPEDWRNIPASRYWRAIAHIEAVLLSISPDGRLNAGDLNGTAPVATLDRWAEHLRSALKELTRRPAELSESETDALRRMF